jgi:serine/threonine protein kinase
MTEYATEGNCDDFFTKSEESEPTASCSGSSSSRLPPTRFHFLHDNNVEHGGLKTTNLLVTREDGKLVAMVSDFGMAVVRTESVSVSFHARSEMVRWKAPERLVQATDAVDFRRADTYSLGLCLCDAASGDVPYGLKDDDEIITSKLNSEPIERPDGAFTDDEWALVSRMIDNNPVNRPSLDEAIARMSELDVIRQRN